MSDNEELRRLVHKSRERLRPENIATALTSGEYISNLAKQSFNSSTRRPRATGKSNPLNVALKLTVLL